MIQLHQYPSSWELPSSSPFCIKVETYLRMAQIPYEIVWENNPGRGPKGKMPFIQDGNQVIADSSFILQYLQKKYNFPLDQILSDQEKSVMLSFQRTIEESLYWVLLYSRWGDEQGWQEIKKEFTPFLPRIIGGYILKIIRKNLLKQSYYQGMGRHSPQEIYHIGITDLKAIATYMEDKAFFMGEHPCSIDCSVYSFLVTILWSPIDCPLKDCIKSFSHIENYCEHIINKYFQ